ncbi:hypothetical protein HDU87_001954 [Geranomyces variabilis]|uniref:Uncharacterized protein n=1 Tax=Geranomyces variabilis TaxID=109894 RepID=A0AAD5XTJ5_9FUNG|nr:hypothetical protein HDU87_001954 [Geranomyces variabilis]
MASSVRIQEPYPLSAHPFSVALTRRIALLPSTPSTTQPLPPPPALAPLQFLTAAVAEHAYGHCSLHHHHQQDASDDTSHSQDTPAVDHAAQVVTVQGSAVYLYDLRRQQCLHSWSVPPGTLFSCPARYLPEQLAHDDPSATATAAAAQDANNNDDDVHAAASSNNLAGNVYAVIHTATDIPAKEEQKSVWMWQVDTAAAAAGEADGVTPTRAGKPNVAAIFDSPIQHLATFVPCKTAAAAAFVVLVHVGGNVTVASRALNTVATWSASASSAAASQVIWTTTFTELETDNHGQDVDDAWKVLRIVSVLRRRVVGGKDTYSVRVLVITAKESSARGGSTATVNLFSETAIPMPDDAAAAPVSFTLVAQQLVIAFSDSQVRVYDITRDGTELLCFSIADCKYVLPTNPATLGGPTMLSMHQIDTNYMAVVGSTAASRKAAGDELLTIWDIKYGAMHFQKLLNASDKSSSAVAGGGVVGSADASSGGGSSRRGARAFHTTMTVSPLTGPVITIATSRVHTLSPVTFSSTVDFVPFHCPPLTLAAVLGKLRKPLLFPTYSSSPSPPLGSVIDHNAIKPVGMGMATTAPVPPPSSSSSSLETDDAALAVWNTQLHDLDATDVDYVQRLLMQTDSDTFSKLFCEWMQKKLLALHEINVQAAEAARRRLAAESAGEVLVGKKEKKRKGKKAAAAGGAVDAMDVDGGDEAADVKEEAGDDSAAMDVDADDANTKIEIETAVTSTTPTLPPPAPQQEQQQQQQQPPLATYLTSKPSPKLLNRLPKVLISPTALNPLLAFCLRHPTKPQTFWPRHAMQYMLRSGAASTKCVAHGGILAAALEKGDMAIIETALRWCADLGEEEIVRAVQWVCVASDDDNADGVAGTRMRMLDSWADATRRARDKKTKAGMMMNVERSRQANLPEEGVELEVDLAEVAEEIEEGEIKTEQGGSIKIENSLSTTATVADAAQLLPGRGRAQFLRAIFARPRTDTFFVRALKKLSVEEVTVLLDWLHGILVVGKVEDDSDDDDDAAAAAALANESESQNRAPLWWFWEQPKFDDTPSVCQGRSLEEWDMALDVLPIILTAHLATILHTPTLVAQLAAMQESITLQTRLFTTLQTRLRAPLLLLHAEMAKKVEEEQQHAAALGGGGGAKQPDAARFDADGKDKTKGRRYKRMVEDVAGAKYEVEIYKI